MRIYQVLYRTIPAILTTQNVLDDFLCEDKEPKKLGKDEYEEVADKVEATDLEQLFRIMNVVDGSDFELPQKLKCRSMSVGDLAVDLTDNTIYQCSSVGWTKVQWKE